MSFFSPHYVNDLLVFYSGKVNVSFEQLYAIPGAFPFFRCLKTSFISALLGSDLSISSIPSGDSISVMLTGLVGFSLVS